MADIGTPEPAPSILDLLAAALLAVQPDGRIYYGTAAQHPAGEPWNYTVFSRDTATVDRNGYTESYSVAVVREDYIPDGTMEAAVEAAESIIGIRLADDTCEYVYDVKPDTNRTVEMMVLHLQRARKRGR